MMSAQRVFAAGALVLVAGMCSAVSATGEPRLRDSLAAAVYFPLAGGNEWVYERHGAGDPTTWRVAVTAPPDAAERSPYFTLIGYFPVLPRQVRADRSQRVTEHDPGGGRDLLWYLLGAPEGTAWELRLAQVPGMGPPEPCLSGAKLVLASRSETVRVPAGTFENVVRIDWRPPCVDAGITSEWFAPGVGLVRREEASIAGPVISELVQATVNGTGHPPRGYQTALTLEAPLLFNDLMPPVDEGSLPVARGAFTLANPTELPVELTFSGCASASLEVTDRDGRVVLTARAEGGGCCACDVVERIVLVRDRLVLPFAFRLVTPDGGPFPDGWYAVSATLETLDPPALRPSARARIEVRSVY